MYSNKKIIAIIPARGGSKGIPRKSVKPLCGKPLIAYAIELALSSKYIDKVLVTSEDDEILSVAKKHGAAIYKRPAHLSNDEITLDDVIYDAVKNLKNKYEIAITIQATSPLLKTKTLDKAVKEIINKNKDSVMSLEDKTHLYWKEKNNKIVPDFTKRLNRQYLNKTYTETGAIIGAKTEYILKNKIRINTESICFVITKKDESIDIDEYTDWQLIELIMNRKKIGIHVIGGEKTGLGHIYRQLTISLYLNSKPIFFIKKDQELAIAKVEENHYSYITYKGENDLLQKIKEQEIDILISDILDTRKELIRKIKSFGTKTITFEDLGSGAKEADMSINALYEFSHSEQNMYYGYKYVCLRPDILFSPQKHITKEMKIVLIACGSVDENNLTDKYLAALQKINFNGKIRVVMGIGYRRIKELKNKYKNSNLSIRYFENIPNMADFILEADLVLTSNGRTMYEIAAVGTPCIAICQNQREAQHTFSTFCDGISNLGLANMVSIETIIKEIKKYYNFNFRKKQNKKMLSFELKKGVKKVIDIINNL